MVHAGVTGFESGEPAQVHEEKVDTFFDSSHTGNVFGGLWYPARILPDWRRGSSVSSLAWYLGASAVSSNDSNVI